MRISLDKTEVVALVLECISFGIFTPFFCVTLWVLANRSTNGRNSRPLALTVCLMYTLAVVHLSIDVYRAITAFVDYADIPHGSIVFYGKLNDPTEIAKTAVYALQTILADSFFVWRCYIVWNRSWSVIVLPVMMVIGTTIATIVVCWEFSRAKPGNVVFESVLVPWVTSAGSMTLATTMICSGLIAFKIWRSQRLLKEMEVNSSLLPVVVIVIESGAIYSAAMISMIATYASGNNSQYIVIDILPSLIGIVFASMIIRVALGISSGGSTAAQSHRARTSLPDFVAATGHQDEDGDVSTKPKTFLLTWRNSMM